MWPAAPGGAPDGRAGDSRGPAGSKVKQDHLRRRSPRPPVRPTWSDRDFTAARPQSAVGGRPDLCVDLVGVRATRRSSSTSSPGGSWGGGVSASPAGRAGPGRPGDGHLVPGHRIWTAWSITRTGGCNTWRSATPSAWPKTGPWPRWGPRATRYDNALAETVNGLYKTELIKPRGTVADPGSGRARPPPMGPVVERRGGCTRRLRGRPAGGVRSGVLGAAGPTGLDRPGLWCHPAAERGSWGL